MADDAPLPLPLREDVRVVLVPRDRIRISRPMLQVIMQAVQHQEDFVVVQSCMRTGEGEVRLVLNREGPL